MVDHQQGATEEDEEPEEVAGQIDHTTGRCHVHIIPRWVSPPTGVERDRLCRPDKIFPVTATPSTHEVPVAMTGHTILPMDV